MCAFGVVVVVFAVAVAAVVVVVLVAADGARRFATVQRRVFCVVSCGAGVVVLHCDIAWRCGAARCCRDFGAASPV